MSRCGCPLVQKASHQDGMRHLELSEEGVLSSAQRAQKGIRYASCDHIDRFQHAARRLLGVMTVGMSEVPYACVRGELSALPESERALHRHELWETCQQRLAQ